MTLQLAELKARKAKFGFAGGCIHLGNVVEVGQFFYELRRVWPGEFTEELQGYNNPEIRVYTNNETVANWIRNTPYFRK